MDPMTTLSCWARIPGLPPPPHSHRTRRYLCSFPVTWTPPPPYLGKKIYPLSRVLVYHWQLQTSAPLRALGRRMRPPYAFELGAGGGGGSYNYYTQLVNIWPRESWHPCTMHMWESLQKKESQRGKNNYSYIHYASSWALICVRHLIKFFLPFSNTGAANKWRHHRVFPRLHIFNIGGEHPTMQVRSISIHLTTLEMEDLFLPFRFSGPQRQDFVDQPWNDKCIRARCLSLCCLFSSFFFRRNGWGCLWPVWLNGRAKWRDKAARLANLLWEVTWHLTSQVIERYIIM